MVTKADALNRSFTVYQLRLETFAEMFETIMFSTIKFETKTETKFGLYYILNSQLSSFRSKKWSQI